MFFLFVFFACERTCVAAPQYPRPRLADKTRRATSFANILRTTIHPFADRCWGFFLFFLYSSCVCTDQKVMEALGVGIGLKTVCIVGGIDMFQQVTLGCCSLARTCEGVGNWDRGYDFAVP